MKLRNAQGSIKRAGVTPLAGVWVEIRSDLSHEESIDVTPLAGVWVEINSSYAYFTSAVVTPLAGVWVEIFNVSF